MDHIHLPSGHPLLHCRCLDAATEGENRAIKPGANCQMKDLTRRLVWWLCINETCPWKPWSVVKMMAHCVVINFEWKMMNLNPFNNPIGLCSPAWSSNWNRCFPSIFCSIPVHENHGQSSRWQLTMPLSILNVREQTFILLMSPMVQCIPACSNIWNRHSSSVFPYSPVHQLLLLQSPCVKANPIEKQWGSLLQEFRTEKWLLWPII